MYHVSDESLNYHTILSSQDKWHGACLDTGAQTTVIGLRQAKAYCKYMKIEFNPKKSSNKYRFGDDQQQSIGTITIRIPIMDNLVISKKVDVVPANVRFLIGLDFLDKYRFYINNVENNLCIPILNVKIPIIRKRGHIS